jgi:hypothetical protein
MTFGPRTPQPSRSEKLELRNARNWSVAQSVRATERSSAVCGGEVGGAVAKENAVYSESYRRLVAVRPCIHCQIEGYSQAAHPPPTAKGRKEDDRECFPLCCTRIGVRGCHVDFDQYRLIPAPAMREQARTWGRQTRASIRNAGEWPANLLDWIER